MIDRIQATPPLQPLFGRLPQHAGRQLISYIQDQLSLSKPDRSTSLGLVNELVESHLAEAFPAFEPSIKSEASEDSESNTAKGVAESIFKRITGDLFEAVQRANPGLTEQQFDLFAANVMKGVGRGVSEAREVLESMDALSEEVEADVAETEEVLVDRLELWVDSTRSELFEESEASEQEAA